MSAHAHVSVPYREELDNIGNVMYTGSIDVGNQSLKAILDTGSFELLVLSSECVVCGDVSKLYDPDSSSDFEDGKETSQHSFGSGVTFSREAFDTVRAGSMVSRRQHFWRVIDAMMPVLGESRFAAIVGVGPADSLDKLEQTDPGEERVLVHTSNAMGNGTNEDRGNTSAELGLSTKFGMDTFSVCIRKGSDSPGVFVWNDVHPSRHTGMFTSVPVAGDIHWAASMRNVQVGPDGDVVEIIGCRDGCAAVIDSGTSLIAAPTEAIMRLDFALAKLREDCSNLHEMPDFVFMLGGQTFSLPPDAYIGRVVESSKPSARHILRGRFRSKSYQCAPLLMPIDADTQLGPLWILGLPFFRKYYSTFSFDASKKPVQKHLSMALADGDCQPTTEDQSLLGSRLPMKPALVDLSQIRMAPWVEQAMVATRVRV